eukprot:1161039-Pelagomonas_calceolata.AAC.6
MAHVCWQSSGRATAGAGLWSGAWDSSCCHVHGSKINYRNDASHPLVLVFYNVHAALKNMMCVGQPTITYMHLRTSFHAHAGSSCAGAGWLLHITPGHARAAQSGVWGRAQLSNSVFCVETVLFLDDLRPRCCWLQRTDVAARLPVATPTLHPSLLTWDALVSYPPGGPFEDTGENVFEADLPIYLPHPGCIYVAPLRDVFVLRPPGVPFEDAEGRVLRLSTHSLYAALGIV